MDRHLKNSVSKANRTALDVKLLVFDVFGTVVDWRGSILSEAQSIWIPRGMDIDWEQFVDLWRAGYQPKMDQIRNGSDEWATIDVLHRQILNELLIEFNVYHLTEVEKAELNGVWHRLKPWDDVLEGLQILRRHFIVTTLSNGNMSLLVSLSKNANLQWDCILSSELARHYKPDLETYQMACDLMGVQPEHTMMVASHRGDLLAAQQIGMRTGFVHRPMEYGVKGTPEVPDASFDLVVKDFHDLFVHLTSA